MSRTSDIVSDLKTWLSRRPTGGQSSDPPVDLVRRAIEEIEALRAKLGDPPGNRTIASEDLNASNDE
jgi:hypothetical protein